MKSAAKVLRFNHSSKKKAKKSKNHIMLVFFPIFMLTFCFLFTPLHRNSKLYKNSLQPQRITGYLSKNIGRYRISNTTSAFLYNNGMSV